MTDIPTPTAAVPAPQTFTWGPKNPRGVCSECGKPAYKGSATKCEEHRTTRAKMSGPSRVTPDADFEIRRPGPPAEPAKTEDPKAARSAALAKGIRDDLNPVLLQGFAMLCSPVPTENFYVVSGEKLVPTELGKACQIDGMKANLLAKGLAELEKSPVSAAAEAYIKPFLPVVYGVLALGVVGFHGYQLITIRDQITRAYAAQVAAQGGATPPAEQAAQQAAQAGYTVPDGDHIDVAQAPPPPSEADLGDLPNVAALRTA